MLLTRMDLNLIATFQPAEVPSTKNRHGTLTIVDMAVPNVGGEDTVVSEVSGGANPSTFHRKRRVCEKNGSVRIKYKNLSNKRKRKILDLYTTLVEMT